jgi:hypothetical protein
MKRVVALLLAVSAVAAPCLAAHLPKPELLVDRQVKKVYPHSSMRPTKADRTRRGKAWNPLAFTPTPRLSHGVRQ